MAIEGISISLNEVSSTAGTLRSLNSTLGANLANIKSEINNLQTTWQSDSADTIQSKINGMQVQFDEYSKVIEAYAKFLDETVSSYQETENAINSSASAFQ